MPDLPGGTVTFLFTDIEGSTKLWEAHSKEMRIGLARHDVLLRDAVANAGGYVFKTVGDGFCAAFGSAPDAVSAALNAQRALNAEPWPEETRIKVRMALHTGAIECRDRDYFGPPLNRVARLLSTASGGQTLVSQATYELSRDALPEAASLLALGAHRLKDLARPEQVFELQHPELPADFPQIKSLSTHPNNLPQQLTSFIGREKEIAEVETLLVKSRLLTLTGAGGSGKTRLGLQVAAESLVKFPDGVWFVELAPLSDPGLVPQTIATALGVQEKSGETIVDTLVEYLKKRCLLLLLDNCEHLRDASARLADVLIRQCPEVHILASSREALGIVGEQTYRVPSLSLPERQQIQTPKTLSAYESVQLFIDRALLVRAEFQVTNHNAPALASVCWHLDGIPLAIELAAARVGSLSVEEINAKLDQRFRLLTGGSRTGMRRHQTLRSLIDWSYDLLSESEQRLLQRLSVFSGGSTMAAAEQVCAGEEVAVDEVLDLLTSLSDKNLVVAEPGDGHSRYRLLETVGQYARDKLASSGRSTPVLQRHMNYFLTLAEEAEKEMAGKDQQAWLDRIAIEHDNLRAALTWSSTADGDAASRLRLAGAVSRFWLLRGYFAEGRARLSELLEVTQEQRSAVRAKLLNGAGRLAANQGDHVAARALHEECLALRRELDDRPGIAGSLGNLGSEAFSNGDYSAARALYTECLAIFRELNDRWAIANTLGGLGMVAREQGDFPRARTLDNECLTIHRGMGNPSGIAFALANLALVTTDQGDFATARTLHEEGLGICRQLGDRLHMGAALSNLGVVAAAQGDYIGARTRDEESLAIRRDLGDRWGIAMSLNNLGELAAAQGDYVAARKLHDESLAIRRDLGDRQNTSQSLFNLGIVAFEQGNYEDARALHCQSLDIRRELGSRWGILRSLEGLACVTFALVQPDSAARIWGAEKRLQEEISAPLVPKEQLRHDKLVSSCRATLGEAAFDRTWHEGYAMTADQAVEFALKKHGP